MEDIEIKGIKTNEISIITEEKDLEKILENQFKYYGSNGVSKNKKIDTSMKDFFVNTVLNNKVGYTIDNFFDDVILNKLCPYTLEQFFEDIVLNREVKNYTLGDLLDYAVDKERCNDPFEFCNNILNSHCPYTEFKGEKEKIKYPFREIVADMLADYLFNKMELDIEEKVKALENLEESLNFCNYHDGLDQNQLRELNKEVEKFEEYLDNPPLKPNINRLRELNKEMDRLYGENDENRASVVAGSSYKI